MKIFYEQGVLPESDIYVNTLSDFSKKNLFNIDRYGHFYVNKKYCHSRYQMWNISPYRNQSSYIYIYIKSGQFIFASSSDQNIINPSEYCILPLYRPHIYSAYTNSEFYWFTFQGCSSEALVNEITKHGNVFSALSPQKTLASLENIRELLEHFTEFSEFQCSNYVHSFLIETLCSIYEKENHVSQDILNITQYIHNHYMDNITLTQLSKIAHLNPSYLSQKFKKELGMSPQAYIITYRLQAATALLHETSLNISQICTCVGFNNEAHFSYTFKNHFGISPSEFRQR